MKRINILLTIITILCASCSKPSLEDKAKERIAIYTDSVRFEGVKVLISNDSLCLAHFYVMNDSGNVNAFEYFIQKDSIKNNGKSFVLYECLYPLGSNQSIISMTEQFLNSMNEKNIGIGKEPNDVVYLYGQLQRIAIGGFKVE